MHKSEHILIIIVLTFALTGNDAATSDLFIYTFIFANILCGQNKRVLQSLLFIKCWLCPGHTSQISLTPASNILIVTRHAAHF